MNFQELREKSMQGRQIRYLKDPTANEMMQYMKNTKYGSLRMVFYDDILYAWAGKDQTHAGFVTQELLEYLKDYSILPRICGYVTTDGYLPRPNIGKTINKHREIQIFIEMLADKYHGSFEQNHDIVDDEIIYTFTEDE